MKLLQIVQTLLVLSFGSVAMAWKSPHTSNIAKFRGKQLSSLESPAQVLIDSNYNLAAGSAVVGTLFGVLENFKGRTAQVHSYLTLGFYDTDILTPHFTCRYSGQARSFSRCSVVLLHSRHPHCGFSSTTNHFHLSKWAERILVTTLS